MNGKILLEHISKWRLLYVVTLLASLSFAGVSAFDNYAPTVVSDKDDYAPGDTAIITGYGWTQDEYVDIHLEEEPAHEHHHGYHDTKVNPDGTWMIKYPIESRHLGVKFTVIVEGKQTGAKAYTYFTDGNVHFKAAGLPSNVDVSVDVTYTPVTQGASQITETITFRSNNNGNVAAKDGTAIYWTFKPVVIGTTTYILSSSTGSQGFIVNGNHTGNSGITGTYITCTTPTITSQPANQSITYGATVNPAFSVGVTGTNPTFQWEYRTSSSNPVWTPIEGANTATYTVSNPSYSMNGYQYRVLVSGCNASVISNPAQLVVTKATATVTLSNLAHTYDGTAKAAVASTDATGTSSFAFTYDGSSEKPVNFKEGGYEVVATLVNDNYTGSATGTLFINKAEQTISWDTPANITYGTPLSETQLNASALDNAALTYTPATGAVLNAGDNQTLTVNAAETNNYKAASATVSINVGKATPTVLLVVGGPYTYDGTTKAASSATITGVAGADLGAATVTYKKEGETVSAPVHAGEYEVLAAFAGNNNYEAANASGTLVITKANAVLTAANLSGKVYNGAAQGVTVTTNPAELNASISIQYFHEGNEVDASEVVTAGDYTYTAALIHPNYEAEAISGSFSISKATLTISADNASKVYGDQNPVFVAAIVKGAVQGENFSVTASSVANAASAVGSYPIVPAVTGATLDNYDVIKNEGTLTIAARPITVTANSGQTKVYGEDNPAVYTYQLTSGNLVEANHLTGVLERVAGEDVATYAITQGTLAATPNYDLTYVGADFEITRRPVTVTADVLSKVYGDTEPKLTYKVTAGSVVSGDNFSGALERAAGENASTYAISLGSLSLGSNYSLSLTEGTVFTIAQKAITVTPNAGQNKVYGSNDPVFEFTSSAALVGNDAFTGKLNRIDGENVGTYAITKGSLALNDNYTLSVNETVTFQITPKALVASISAEDKVYDGTKAATVTGQVPAEDLVSGDVVTVNVSNAAFDTKNAGTNITVRASVSIDHPNYSLSNSTATTTASIEAKAISGSFVAADKVYDGTDAATVMSRSLIGVIEPDNVELTGGTATFEDKNADEGKTVTLAGATLSGEDKGNYSLSNVSTTTANITPKPASVTPLANTKVYGTVDPALTGTIDGFLPADGITASYTRTVGEQVNSYTISATLSPETALGNYAVTYNTAQFEITKAQLIVSADDKTKVYGDENPAFTGTLEGVVNKDVIGVTYRTDATAGSVIGDYAIEPVLSGAALSNYNITKTNGTLTIGKAELSVVANNKTRIYGAANPLLDGVLSGVKNNDAITASYSTEADMASNVGEYAITATLQDPTDKLINYTVSNTPGKLTITQAPASITIADLSKVYNRAAQGATVTTSPADLAVIVTYDGSATAPTAAGSYEVVAKLNNSNYSADEVKETLVIAQKAVTATLAHGGKVYDGTTAAPGTTASLEGVISGDVVTATVTDAAFDDANAGLRTVNATVTLAGNDKANYTLQSVSPGIATISQRALTVAAVAKSKVYGDTDPGLTYNVEAGTLVAGESFSGELKRESGENVGTYAITKHTLSAGDNYAITYIPATLSITAKAITVVADAKSKVYGDADPRLTYMIQAGELVGNDAFTGSLTRDEGETIGSYPITQGSLALSNNYTLTYQGANLVIGKRAVEITADAKSKTYGDNDPALTYQITSGKLAFKDAFTGSLTREAGENVATYAITQGSLALNSNYDLRYVGANLTITKRAITVTAEAKEKMFNQPDPELKYEVTSGELVYNDNFSGSLTRDIGEAAGTYAILQGTLSAGNNYNITYVGANLTIHAIPTVVIDNPAPVKYSTVVSVIANFTGIVNNPVWEWGFGGTSVGVKGTSTITGSATVPSSPGVYKLVIKYQNAVGQELITDPVFISVYDPEGGFVTGGGWINSPAGALANSVAVGKANFGFVAKYKKGKNEVEGNTEFQFQAGGIDFKSLAHDAGSLVIAGSKATYKGTGSIAGKTGTYNFMVVATDSEVNGGVSTDKFRIKIWNGGNVIYDNARNTDENAELGDLTILGGGSIVIHENKSVNANSNGNGKKLEIDTQLEGLSVARFDNYPNAFNDRTTIRFAFDADEQFALEVYDVRGSLIRKVATGKAEAGQVYEYDLDGRNLAEGVYIARLVTGTKAQSIKMILKK